MSRFSEVGSAKKGTRMDIKLPKNDAILLNTYCDHLGISAECLIRRLLQRELVEQRELYKGPEE